MTFVTVFDAGDVYYSQWLAPVFGLLFVWFGVILIFKPSLAKKLFPRGPQGRALTIFSWSFFLLSLTASAVAFVATYKRSEAVSKALRAGKYETIEGPVQDFVPALPLGHSMERFSVQGRQFTYSDFVESAGFHTTASHGGPIKPNLYVRVTHVGNTILRLQVAR